MAGSAGDKTEKATPKRKQDERKKGNIFLSQEVVTVATLIATFYTLKIMMPYAVTSIEAGIKHFTDMASTEDTLTYQVLQKHFFELILIYAKSALLPLFVCGLTATLATMAQTKMLFTAKNASFKGSRINPMQGIKKMFSARSLVELFKSILKITVLIYVIYSILKADIEKFPRMMDMSFDASLLETGNIIMAIVIKVSTIFIVLAGADFMYQRWDYEKNLRMSKQEVKDEYKETEGDPQIKGRIRSIQQQSARRRMMQNVPKADVVIRNPTHIAIAIKYDQNANAAPMVVAKGTDNVALKIVKIAEENGVYITENKPLARALYESVELDREIPEQFYRAIAEVLAFVYNLKKKQLK